MLFQINGLQSLTYVFENVELFTFKFNVATLSQPYMFDVVKVYIPLVVYVVPFHSYSSQTVLFSVELWNY